MAPLEFVADRDLSPSREDLLQHHARMREEFIYATTLSTRPQSYTPPGQSRATDAGSTLFSEQGRGRVFSGSTYLPQGDQERRITGDRKPTRSVRRRGQTHSSLHP